MAGAMVSMRFGASSNIGGKSRLMGMTLMELLVVVAILLVLAGFGFSLIRNAMEESDLARCASNLHQTGIALNAYCDEWRVYPEAAPPLGFGDLHNWGDLYAASAPSEGDPFNNMTVYPRVPRVLTDYLHQTEPLICASHGASEFWPEIGPYYYNVTSPWFNETLPDGHLVSNYGRWVPRHALSGGEKHALAACQNPQRSGQAFGSWRHGMRAPSDPDGRNNHLFANGSVHTLWNPASWTTHPCE